MKRIIFTRKWATAGAVAFAAAAMAFLPAQAEPGTSSSSQSSQSSGGSSGGTSGGSSGGTSGAMSGGSSGGSFSSSDRSFIRDAAEGGMAEVRMGELGQQKTSNSEVRTLAKRLQEDHQKANDELKSLAQSKGIDLPTSMVATQQSAISDLESKQSSDFDRQFVQHAIQDHQKDISTFEQASQNASDPELKAWAQKTLPVLREHLQLAQKAQQSLGQ